MMIHAGEGTLQALLDGELSSTQLSALEPHIAGCGRCEGDLASLRAARSLVSGALPALDITPPTEAALREVRARMAAGRAARFPTIALGRAAAIVLVSAAALSATVPGSPVRGWIEDVWRADARPAMPPPASDAGDVAAIAAPGTDNVAGVSMLPPAEGMRIMVVAPGPGLPLSVTFHDGPRLGVWATDDAGARFRTGADRVEVHGATAGGLRVEIPRSMADLTIDVGGEVYMVKDGDRIIFPGPAADTSGPEIRFRIR